MTRKEYFLKAFDRVNSGNAYFEMFPKLTEEEIRYIQRGEIPTDDFFKVTPRQTSIDIGGVVYIDGIDEIPQEITLCRKGSTPHRHRGNWFDIIA